MQQFSAVRHPETSDEAVTKWDEFAVELSELSSKFGIGLQGATAYRMEADDFLFSFHIGDDGAVARY